MNNKRTGNQIVDVLRLTVTAVETRGGTVQAVQFQETHCDCPDTVIVAARLSSWESAINIFDDLAVDTGTIDVKAPEGFGARMYIGLAGPSAGPMRYVLAALVRD